MTSKRRFLIDMRFYGDETIFEPSSSMYIKIIQYFEMWTLKLRELGLHLTNFSHIYIDCRKRNSKSDSRDNLIVEQIRPITDFYRYVDVTFRELPQNINELLKAFNRIIYDSVWSVSDQTSATKTILDEANKYIRDNYDSYFAVYRKISSIQTTAEFLAQPGGIYPGGGKIFLKVTTSGKTTCKFFFDYTNFSNVYRFLGKIELKNSSLVISPRADFLRQNPTVPKRLSINLEPLLINNTIEINETTIESIQSAFKRKSEL